MRQMKLYSLSLPLMLFPVLDFSFSQVGPYLKGMEFRTFLSEIVTQLLSGVTDAFIIAVVTSGFGLGA